MPLCAINNNGNKRRESYDEGMWYEPRLHAYNDNYGHHKDISSFPKCLFLVIQRKANGACEMRDYVPEEAVITKQLSHVGFPALAGTYYYYYRSLFTKWFLSKLNDIHMSPESKC